MSVRNRTANERMPATATRAEVPARAWIYASFADGVGGGNPAGVVLSEAPLASVVAHGVAAVLSVPTTGFAVLPSARGQRVVEVRFFTPDQEIDACGHVTIAVAAALVECGLWRWGEEVAVCAPGGEFP